MKNGNFTANVVRQSILDIESKHLVGGKITVVSLLLLNHVQIALSMDRSVLQGAGIM